MATRTAQNNKRKSVRNGHNAHPSVSAKATHERVMIPIAPYKRIILLTVFGLSGAAALMYEVVWSRSLQFIFGSTIETVSTIFSAFLLGFALGSFLFRNVADTTKSPLFYVATFEIGIGLYGFLMPAITSVSASFIHQFLSHSLILKTGFCLLILVVPTTLCGAIWPFISRYYVQRSARIGAGTGSIYSVNSAGSALGAVVSGFILVPFFGIRAASFIAASINLLAGVLIFFVKEPKIEE